MQTRRSASREYTLAVLGKMPDERFGFRPTPEEWTFSQQLTHIAGGNLLIAAPLRGDKPVYVGAPRQLARAELKQHLEHRMPMWPRRSNASPTMPQESCGSTSWEPKKC